MARTIALRYFEIGGRGARVLRRARTGGCGRSYSGRISLRTDPDIAVLLEMARTQINMPDSRVTMRCATAGRGASPRGTLHLLRLRANASAVPT